MKTKFLVVGLISSVICASVANAQTVSSTSSQELVVDFNDSVSAEEAQAIASRVGVTLTPNSERMVASDRIYRLTVDSGDSQRVMNYFRSQGSVQGADVNRVMRMSWTPNDPQFEDQWGLRRVGVQSAWNTTCGRNVRVAVVDTGVACENHGEFTRLTDLAGTRCDSGWDFVSDDEHANDDQGHGSHVAGTIAQTTNNRLGGAGIAHCATIIPVKVLDEDGSGSLADVAEGIRFSADAGAHVINLSLGGGGRSKIMEDAIAYARARGTVVICAAGNNGRYVESPANEPGAFAVSAVGPGDFIANFSSRGPEVDIAAPGVNILQQTICNHGRGRCEQYAAWSGTSMATPHVAGIAALIVSMGVTDVDAVENILRNSAVTPDHGNSDSSLYGAGVASASHAVERVKTTQAMYRLASLGILLGLIAARIKSKGGKLDSPMKWAPFALVSGVGLFFLPWIMPFHSSLIELLSRPLGDWTLMTNMTIHQWLPLGSALLPFAAAAASYSSKRFRAPVGGFALGTGAFLLGTLGTGFHSNPLGLIAMIGWTAINVFALGALARITLDKTKNDVK